MAASSTGRRASIARSPRRHRTKDAVAQRLAGPRPHAGCGEQGSNLAPARTAGAQLLEERVKFGNDALHRTRPQWAVQCRLEPASFLQRCLFRNHPLRLSRPSIGRNSPKQCATIFGCSKRYASPESVAKCFIHTCASLNDACQARAFSSFWPDGRLRSSLRPLGAGRCPPALMASPLTWSQ